LPFESEWYYNRMAAIDIISITDSVSLRQPIMFEIESAFNTPCYEYGFMDVDIAEPNIYIQFVQKRHKDRGACPQMEVPYNINESIRMLVPGQYNIHFMQTDSTSIDTVVTVY